MDPTQKRDSKSIDSIAVLENLITHIKGYKLLETNEVISTDYRSFIIDINLEDYFTEQLTCLDNINKIILNSSRK